MPPYLMLLCFLSIFTRTGHSLSCTVCLVQGANFCTGNNVSCPAGRVCASTYQINMEDGVQKSQFFGRSCVPASQCGPPGSFSTYNSKSRKAFSCCYTDNCTPSPPEMRPDNIKPNGLVCPTCKGNGTQWCHTERTMKCTGEETRCIVQYSKLTGSLSSETILRGCATPNICNIGNETIMTNGISAEVQITCTGSAGGIHHRCHLHGIVLLVFFILTIV